MYDSRRCSRVGIISADCSLVVRGIEEVVASCVREDVILDNNIIARNPRNPAISLGFVLLLRILDLKVQFVLRRVLLYTRALDVRHHNPVLLLYTTFAPMRA